MLGSKWEATNFCKCMIPDNHPNVLCWEKNKDFSLTFTMSDRHMFRD